jgi:acetylornithine deacetylase/succinyl-diaminopimelate desuccinylase-like protein
MLAALDAMRASRMTPTVNLRFVLEGEEEKDSPHLRAYLEHHRARRERRHAADGEPR